MAITNPCVYAVVLNYNGLACNSRCLNSLLAQDYSALRILFVDNGSTDGSLEAVRREFTDQLEYLDNHENLYFAGGNNRGMQHVMDAGAEYIFIVNNDTELEPDCVSELVRFMESHPDAGGCQPLIRYMDATTGGFSDRVASAGVRVSLSGRCWDHRMGDRTIDMAKEPQAVDGITGGAMMLPAWVIREVGIFNEDYVMYFEDVDLSFRILEAGHPLYVVPSAEMGHAVGATTSEHAPLLRIKRCEANSYRIIADHFPGTLALRGFLASLCFSMVSLAKALLHGDFRRVRAVWSGMIEGAGYFFGNWRKVVCWSRNSVVRPHISESVLFPPA